MFTFVSLLAASNFKAKASVNEMISELEGSPSVMKIIVKILSL